MQGKYDDATKPLQLCLELHPDDVRARLYLALNLLCQGNRSEAFQQLDRGLSNVEDRSVIGSALREAEVLAARTPEVSGAKDMLEKIKNPAGGVVQ